MTAKENGEARPTDISSGSTVLSVVRSTALSSGDSLGSNAPVMRTRGPTTARTARPPAPLKLILDRLTNGVTMDDERFPIYPKDISHHITESEGMTLEFKRQIPPTDIIAKIICAFANSEGGLLIIGIDDFDDPQKPKIMGIDETRFHSQIGRVISACQKFTFSITHGIAKVGGKKLYVVEVERQDKPVTFDSVSFIRVGPNIRVSERASESILGKVVLLEGARLAEERWLNPQPKTDHFANFMIYIQELLDAGSRCITPGRVAMTDIPILQSIFCSAINSFEVYLADLLLEIYLTHDEKRKEITAQLSYRELFEIIKSVGSDDMTECLIRKYEAKIRKDKNYAALYKSIVQGGSAETRIIETEFNKIRSLIDFLFQFRHSCTHNRGRADEELTIKRRECATQGFADLPADGNSLGERFLFFAVKTLIEFSQRIDIYSIEQYKLNKE